MEIARNWKRNAKLQEEALRKSLDDAAIAYEWMLVDGGPAAVVRVDGDTEVELWCPNSRWPSRRQYVRADVWSRSMAPSYSMAYHSHPLSVDGGAVEDAAQLVAQVFESLGAVVVPRSA